MTLIDLLNHVGLDHVKVQRIDQSCLGARQVKGGILMQVETNQLTVNDVMGFTEGVTPTMHGVILWLPSDRLPKATVKA